MNVIHSFSRYVKGHMTLDDFSWTDPLITVMYVMYLYKTYICICEFGLNLNIFILACNKKFPAMILGHPALAAR